jgi:hypothetical protein
MVDQKQKEKNTAILFSLCVCDSLPEYVARSVYYSSVMLRFPSRGVLLLFFVAPGPLSTPSFLYQNVSNIEHVWP